MAAEPLTPEETPAPLGAPWSPLEAAPIAIFALVATALLTAVTPPPTGTGLILLALFFEAALAGFTLLWVRLRYRGSLPALRLRSRRVRADVAVGFGWGLALFAITVVIVAQVLYWVLSLVTGEQVLPPQQPVLPTDPTSFQVVLGGVAVLLAAPAGEEIFFRGFIFGGLRRRLGFGWSATLSAITFGLFHVVPLLMPLMFFVGLGLAYLYERRGSLLAPIAAHAAFNVVGYAFIVSALR